MPLWRVSRFCAQHIRLPFSTLPPPGSVYSLPRILLVVVSSLGALVAPVTRCRLLFCTSPIVARGACAGILTWRQRWRSPGTFGGSHALFAGGADMLCAGWRGRDEDVRAARICGSGLYHCFPFCGVDGRRTLFSPHLRRPACSIFTELNSCLLPFSSKTWFVAWTFHVCAGFNTNFDTYHGFWFPVLVLQRVAAHDARFTCLQRRGALVRATPAPFALFRLARPGVLPHPHLGGAFPSWPAARPAGISLHCAGDSSLMPYLVRLPTTSRTLLPYAPSRLWYNAVLGRRVRIWTRQERNGAAWMPFRFRFSSAAGFSW